jgi:DNA-binding NarL/FixJ family response regulator
MREPPKPLQVYVVEGSAIIRRLIASTIDAAGAKLIGERADAASAIVDLGRLRPDLILLDISLKSGTGFDVLEALKECDPRQSALKVVLTRDGSAAFRDLSFRMGANGFFDKATQMHEVLALINALAAEKLRRRAPRAKPLHPTEESDSRI